MSDPQKEPEAQIILISDGEGHWLIKGEEYLSAMLSAEEYFPTPVICHYYDTTFDLMRDLDEGVILNSLWAIHPGIIGRLKREDHIIEKRK